MANDGFPGFEDISVDDLEAILELIASHPKFDRDGDFATMELESPRS